MSRAIEQRAAYHSVIAGSVSAARARFLHSDWIAAGGLRDR